MKLRELTEVLPYWTTLRIVNKGNAVEVNPGPGMYRDFFKEEILDAEVSLIEIGNCENYKKDTLIVKIKLKDEMF